MCITAVSDSVRMEKSDIHCIRSEEMVLNDVLHLHWPVDVVMIILTAVCFLWMTGTRGAIGKGIACCRALCVSNQRGDLECREGCDQRAALLLAAVDEMMVGKV